MKNVIACLFVFFRLCHLSHVFTQLSNLDKQITNLLEDPSLQSIEEAMHFMNLYCMEISNITVRLEQNKAGDIMDDIIKFYKQGRPRFVDTELNEYELKKYLYAKQETLNKFKVLQSDARCAWDEFVTTLIKKYPEPI